MILHDARVPVVFAPAQPRPDDVGLAVGDDPEAGIGHVPGCACCGRRSPAGQALTALLQARARGQVGFFRRVVVECTEAGRAQVLEALRTDPVASACFKVSPSSSNPP